jgi:hypothetical protein
MTITIEYTKDNVDVTLYQEGVVTGENLIDAISNVFGDQRYLSLKYWIADRTALSELLVDTNALRIIAELNMKESLRNPRILLAPVTGVSKGY